MAKYVKLPKADYDLLHARVKGLLDTDKTLKPAVLYKMIKPSYEGSTRLTKGHIWGLWRKVTGYVPATKRGPNKSTRQPIVRQTNKNVKSFAWPADGTTTASVAKLNITYSDGSSVVQDHAIALIEAGLRLLKQGGTNG